MSSVAYLRDVCQIAMGQAPPGDSYNEIGDGMPLVAGAGDFAGSVPRVKKFTTAPSKVSQPGDIILGIRASIGERVWSDVAYCLGRGVAGLRVSKDLDRNYLWHWLGCSAGRLRAKGRGATFLQVNRSDIGEMEIPLPPLGEQRRIAAILDQADELRAKRRQVNQRTDELIRAIFNAMFGTLPAEHKLADGCIRITDGTHQSPQWSSSGVPFLFISNITSGHIDFNTSKYISIETWKDLTRSTPIEVGDVLYSTVGVTYGIPAVVRSTQRFAFQRHIAHLKPRPDVLLPEFLAAMLASPLLKRQADRAARGAAQPTVNLADIKKFDVILPPLDEQKAFAARMESVRSMRSTAAAGTEEHTGLFISLQSRAFSGQL